LSRCKLASIKKQKGRFKPTSGEKKKKIKNNYAKSNSKQLAESENRRNSGKF